MTSWWKICDLNYFCSGAWWALYLLMPAQMWLAFCRLVPRSELTKSTSVRLWVLRAAGLFRQLWTEAILLWMIGGALGTLFAYWGSEAFASRIPSELASSVRVDTTTLVFNSRNFGGDRNWFLVWYRLWVCRASMLQCGSKKWGRSHTLGGREWLRQGLVILQISLALVLLAASGLLLRSLNRVLGSAIGFQQEQFAHP